MSDKDGLLSIGTFSQITKLSLRALRLYDDKDILKPEFKEITGYRFYDMNQIVTAMRLKNLSMLGFSLQEMKEVVDALEGDVDEKKVNDIISARVSKIESEIQNLEDIRGSLLNKNYLEVIQMNDSKPDIKEVPVTRVLSKTEMGSYPVTIPKLMGELFGLVMGPGAGSAKCIGPPIFICHDDEYKEEGAKVEIAVPISGQLEVTENMEIKNLPAQKVVSVMHKGAYNQVGNAYKVAFEWIGKNGYKPADHTRELYLNDPNEVPEEEQLTEVQIPIEKV